MKSRPILFSPMMVNAILRGLKTQTRREIKNAAAGRDGFGNYIKIGKFEGEFPGDMNFMIDNCSPYGKHGDSLWVRESCWILGKWKKNGLSDTGRQLWKFHIDPSNVAIYQEPGQKPKKTELGFHKRPSIHTPRWASRIDLKITAVKIERLHDISRGDSMQEGCPFQNMNDLDPVGWFRALWADINGQKSWDDNPLVWVVTFKRVQ